MQPFNRSFLFGIVLLFALTACGGGGDGGSTQASITAIIENFFAADYKLALGENTTLTAQFSGDNANVIPGLGNVASDAAIPVDPANSLRPL